MEVLAVPFLLLVGALLAVQSGANVQLSAAAGSPIVGLRRSFLLGAALLVALSAIVGTPGAPGLVDDAEPWHLDRWARLGGLHHRRHPALPSPRCDRDRRAVHHRPDAHVARPRRDGVARRGSSTRSTRPRWPAPPRC